MMSLLIHIDPTRSIFRSSGGHPPQYGCNIKPISFWASLHRRMRSLQLLCVGSTALLFLATPGCSLLPLDSQTLHLQHTIGLLNGVLCRSGGLKRRDTPCALKAYKE